LVLMGRFLDDDKLVEVILLPLFSAKLILIFNKVTDVNVMI